MEDADVLEAPAFWNQILEQEGMALWYGGLNMIEIWLKYKLRLSNCPAASNSVAGGLQSAREQDVGRKMNMHDNARPFLLSLYVFFSCLLWKSI